MELSQKYIADVFGENWQDEYTIWASTLDKQDVDVMLDRIENGVNLLKDHVFQFDFLNDDFSKLPKGLQDIVNDPEKQRKLIIYINPPYAEHGDKKIMFDSQVRNKSNVSITHKAYKDYSKMIGSAGRELFTQFLIKIRSEISAVNLAQFSKLKIVQGSNFKKFRDFFRVKFLKGFVVPANTFDNVKGQFPIGFMIWNLEYKDRIETIECDIYNDKGEKKGRKKFYVGDEIKINSWAASWYDSKNKNIGYIMCHTPDFQHNINVWMANNPEENTAKPITQNNLIESCIYFSVRHCIEATWLNDRDQFLFPNDGWKTDTKFQNDCLAFTLFHTQNRIVSQDGVNHWIPFREQEIDARDKFASSFMTDFINGKLKRETEKNLFSGKTQAISVTKKRNEKLEFSSEAQAVFNAGRELWKYYHKQPNCHANASYYEIREYFQGRNEKGKMNNKSNDKTYNELIKNLRQQIKCLARKIEPKVYEYGFLR